MLNDERPLVTFVLFSYNQQRFVREAVEGAFAQTYSPLKIILSDDCSSDGTYQIMQEMVAAYNGPHQVVLNRNSSNFGLAEHINSVVLMLAGDWVVFAAGDDVSLPERVERMVQAVVGSGRACIFSEVMHIDEFGNAKGVCFGRDRPEPPSLSSVLRTSSCWVLGCSAGYSIRLLRDFPPLNSEVVQEDSVMPFRAIFCGGVLFSGEVLVKYRSHSTNLWNKQDRTEKATFFSKYNDHIVFLDRRFKTVSQWVNDCESMADFNPCNLAKIRRIRRIAKLDFDLATAPTIYLVVTRILEGSCGTTDNNTGILKIVYRKLRIPTIRVVMKGLFTYYLTRFSAK
jgi:glycosyltransferase involved in cell wall biosynthesis